MQPDHADDIGGRQMDRSGEIIDRRLEPTSVELCASAGAKGEGQGGIEPNGLSGIRDCLLCFAFGEVRPSAQAVRVGLARHKPDSSRIIGNCLAGFAQGEICIATVDVSVSSIWIG